MMLSSIKNMSIERKTNMDTNPKGTTDTSPEVESLQPETALPTDKNTNSSEDFSLPENSTDRTKEQFQKLLQSNKELKDQLTQLMSKNTETPAYGSVYESFKANDTVATDESDYVDEDGNVDIKKLNADLKAAKVSALEARRLAEQAREEVEVREAHNKHPYLDPQSPNFDPQFFDLVKDRVLRQKFYEGKNIPLAKIADEVSTFYTPKKVDPEVARQAVEDYKKSREQVSNNMPISSSNRLRDEGASLDDLRKRTREGDSKAIQERLKAIGL